MYFSDTSGNKMQVLWATARKVVGKANIQKQKLPAMQN